MSTQFSERLDFLMNITNTTNSALARALSFDASYISRIRSGKRGVPLHQPFVEPAAAYLAARIREPYQIQVIEQTVGAFGPGLAWPDSATQAAELLAEWLAGENTVHEAHYDGLLDLMAHIPGDADHAGSAELFSSAGNVDYGTLVAEVSSSTVRCAYGDSGKRAATELFLSELIERGGAYKLLLYSDESMTWLTEDPAFLRRWAALIVQLLKSGSTIVVVHTVTRGIGEMLDAVRNWLPLYLTGCIQSLYCPRIRDGIGRRTLFVAPGDSAVVSASVQDATVGMANLLIDDPALVSAYEAEIRNLMDLCRPLVQIVDLGDPQHAASAMARFAGGEGPVHVLYNLSEEPDLERLAGCAPHEAVKLLAGIFASGSALRSEHLPENAIALVSGQDAVAIWHLANPSIALLVTERLLAAALVDYLA